MKTNTADHARETGARTLVEITIAYGGPTYPERPFKAFEAFLNDTFGGFTRWDVIGGWVSPFAETMTEDAVRYSVSVIGALPVVASIEAIASAAAMAGRALGQDWVHITSRPEWAHHIECKPQTLPDDPKSEKTLPDDPEPEPENLNPLDALIEEIEEWYDGDREDRDVWYMLGHAISSIRTYVDARDSTGPQVGASDDPVG